MGLWTRWQVKAHANEASPPSSAAPVEELGVGVVGVVVNRGWSLGGGGCGIRKARHRDAQCLRMLRLTCESRKQKLESLSNELQAAGQRSKNEQRRDRDATLKGLRTRESGTGTKRGASSGLRHHSDVSPGSIGRFWRGRGDGERGARDVFLCWLRTEDT